MAKISKKRFLKLAEQFYLDVNDANTFAGQVYAELNKPKNKWTHWNGGECPVDPDTLVDIKFRDGDIVCKRAGITWDWQHYRQSVDIIAYKIVKE